MVFVAFEGGLLADLVTLESVADPMAHHHHYYRPYLAPFFYEILLE